MQAGVAFVSAGLGSSGPAGGPAAAWTRNEQLFSAVAACPKAAIQASLAAVALDVVQAHKRTGDFYPPFGEGAYDSSFDADFRRADAILTVAVLAVFLAAPAAGALERLGSTLLTAEALRFGGGLGTDLLEEESEEEDEDEDDEAVDGGGGGSFGNSAERPMEARPPFVREADILGLHSPRVPVLPPWSRSKTAQASRAAAF